MMPCPRCLQTGQVYAAGNRIARPCPSCEGKGYISESMATQDDADREIEALRKRVAELERAAEAVLDELSHAPRPRADLQHARGTGAHGARPLQLCPAGGNARGDGYGLWPHTDGDAMTSKPTRERGGVEGEWVPMTWVEFVASDANWADRLWCRLFGHNRSEKWSTYPYCWRCGVDLRSVVTLFRAVSGGEMTPEQASEVLMRRRR